MKNTARILVTALLCTANNPATAAQNTAGFKLMSDCHPIHAMILFSDWGRDAEKDKKINANGVRLSGETAEVIEMSINSDPAKLPIESGPRRRPRLLRRGGIVEAMPLTLPLTKNNFPFRIFMGKVAAGETCCLSLGTSFVFSLDPKVPNTKFMTLEEANSPETILHITCDKNNPNEISDWDIVVESPKREIHKAARNRQLTEAEIKELQRPLSVEEQKRKQEEAAQRGELFVKVPKETGISEIVAGYVAGELSPEEREHFQQEEKKKEAAQGAQ